MEKSLENVQSVSYVPYGAKDKVNLTLQVIKQYIANPTKSGKLPNDRDIFNFMMECQARRLNPFEGDAFLIGYDTQQGPKFSRITAHQAFLKRAELNKTYEGMESGIIFLDKNGELKERQGDFYLDGETLVGGWAKVHDSRHKIPTVRKLNLKTYKRNTAIWNDNPGGMIVKCAEADALRSTYPTMLGGLYIKEEMYDVEERMPDIALNAESTADAFQEKLEQARSEKPPEDQKSENKSQDKVEKKIDEQPPAPSESLDYPEDAKPKPDEPDDSEQNEPEQDMDMALMEQKAMMANQITVFLQKIAKEEGIDTRDLMMEWTGCIGPVQMADKLTLEKLQQIYAGLQETYK